MAEPFVHTRDTHALGVLALGARLGVKKMPCTVHVSAPKRDAISFYERAYETTTLLAAFRDLFIKIGLDFDELVSPVEATLSVPTRTGQASELPHSGVGAWSKYIENKFGAVASKQFLNLMIEARDEWIANYKDLYLLDVSESVAPQTKSLRSRLSQRSATGLIRRTLRNRGLNEFIESVIRSLPAQGHTQSAVMLYLYATFGTFTFSWERCFNALEEQCRQFNVEIIWGQSDQPTHVLLQASDEHLQIDAFTRYGVGPFFELMNAELASSIASRDYA